MQKSLFIRAEAELQIVSYRRFIRWSINLRARSTGDSYAILVNKQSVSLEYQRLQPQDDEQNDIGWICIYVEQAPRILFIHNISYGTVVALPIAQHYKYTTLDLK